MPHSRTDIPQDDIALRVLSGCRYKVLRALVNRADERGICFPGDEYLAQATGYTRRSVQRSLIALDESLVIQYHRRDEWDNFTRRQLPNVMQINPDYICLAAEFEQEARELWDALIKRCGNDSVRLWSRTITNASNQAPEPTPVDQLQWTNTKNQGNRALTEKGQKQVQGRNSPPAGHQREQNDRESSVPPKPERPQYENPQLVNSNLPDAAHEGLASDLRKIGIAMPLGRGFVVEYGYKRTKLAFDQAVKMGEKAREPAAVFRSVLQVRLADDSALAHQAIFGKQKRS